MFRRYSFSLIIAFTLFSCGEEEYRSSVNNKPLSRGWVDDIIVVMSPEWQNSPIKDSLENILSSAYPFTIADETEPQYRRFALLYQWDDFDEFSLRHRNLIFLVNAKSEDQTEKKFLIRTNRISRSNKLSLASDFFAKGQSIAVLKTSSAQSAIDILSKEQEKLVDFFEQGIVTTYQRNLKKEKLNKEFCDLIRKKLNVEMLVPESYLTVLDTNNTLWGRWPGEDFDKNIIISKWPYFEDFMIKDSVMSRTRDQFFMNYVKSSSKTDILQTEKSTKPSIRRYKLNDIFVYEIRGNWSMKNNPGFSGSFISYLIPFDAERGSIYAEGFVFNPGYKEKKSIRKLQAILNTIEIIDE